MYEQLSQVSSRIAFFLFLFTGGFVSLDVVRFCGDETRIRPDA
jgi:hypothetical protein